MERGWNLKMRKGFTLVELLIVIAILGVLAVVVLLALNPAQQLARTRDAGRISTVTQLGHALEAYSTSRNGDFPVEATWLDDMVDAGEISQTPTMPDYSAPGNFGACSENALGGGFCYDASNPSGLAPVVVYARLEAQANNSRCTGAGEAAYAVYSSAQGRAGLVCAASNGELDPGTLTFLP